MNTQTTTIDGKTVEYSATVTDEFLVVYVLKIDGKNVQLGSSCFAHGDNKEMIERTVKALVSLEVLSVTTIAPDTEIREEAEAKAPAYVDPFVTLFNPAAKATEASQDSEPKALGNDDATATG